MISFKSFIVEHKILLNQQPDALETHLKYAKAGVPLPDRDDLYQIYKNGLVRYPKEGGYIQHSPYDRSIGHFNDKDVLHRTDGPAIISDTDNSWIHDGRMIATHSRISYPDNSKLNLYVIRHSDGNSTEYNINEFNKHLEKHGFPKITVDK